MITVLFICVHNSARSQIAEEYLRKLGGDRFQVESAGLEPGRLNPYAVEVLAEDGIDIRDKETKDVYDLYKAGKTYRFVISVCSRELEERCPIFPGAVVRYSWPFEDPAGFEGPPDAKRARMRNLRDEIVEKVRAFIAAAG